MDLVERLEHAGIQATRLRVVARNALGIASFRREATAMKRGGGPTLS